MKGLSRFGYQHNQGVTDSGQSVVLFIQSFFFSPRGSFCRKCQILRMSQGQNRQKCQNMNLFVVVNRL